MEASSEKEEILTVEQVAEWLQVSPAWVRAHANKSRRPHLPGFKAGKYVRFSRAAVRRAVEQWQREAA